MKIGINLVGISYNDGSNGGRYSNYEDSIEHIYSNNEECIHLLKDEYGYLFFGYIQNSNNYEEISNFNGNELIIESLKKNKRFNELCKDYSFESYRSIIVSNFKLSSYPTSDFFKLSNTTSYFYLFEPNENSGYTLDLNQDEDILERIEKEILIKIMIKENSKLNGLNKPIIPYKTNIIKQIRPIILFVDTLLLSLNNIDMNYPTNALSSNSKKWAIRISSNDFKIFGSEGSLSGTLTTARNLGTFGFLGPFFFS
jgi:hypothetical protein